MGNINNFENVKPGTLALAENGLGGANAILVYLINQREVRGFTISDEGVIGCAVAVPHENIIKAFGITCADEGHIRHLLIELFTGNRTACQNLYKIYERAAKIVDMTIEEVSEIVSRQRGEAVKVNIVKQCEESTDAEVADADTEKPDEGVYVSPGDTIEHNGKTIMAIASDEAECPRSCLNGEDCRGLDCMGDCGRTEVVFREVDKDTETINDSACEPITHIYNSAENGEMLEPAIGDIVIYDGVKTVVEESDGCCNDCFLSSRMCGRMRCTANSRKDDKSVKLRKVIDKDTDDNGTTDKREWELSEHSYDSIEPAIGDVVTVYGVRCAVVEGSGSCHKCVAITNGCAFMNCTASDRLDSKYVYLEKVADDVVVERSDDGNSEWSISTQNDDVVEPKL